MRTWKVTLDPEHVLDGEPVVHLVSSLYFHADDYDYVFYDDPHKIKLKAVINRQKAVSVVLMKGQIGKDEEGEVIDDREDED